MDTANVPSILKLDPAHFDACKDAEAPLLLVSRDLACAASLELEDISGVRIDV
jgi:hypothetical protein